MIDNDTSIIDNRASSEWTGRSRLSHGAPSYRWPYACSPSPSRCLANL